tara:strand:- start:424 stop:585 length:162 start_codon:yes stop_codon:yes gene_type:complete
MVKKFKKPSGYVVVYDSKVHSAEYLKNLEKNFEEVKDAPKKVEKKPSKKKGDK